MDTIDIYANLFAFLMPSIPDMANLALVSKTSHSVWKDQYLPALIGAVFPRFVYKEPMRVLFLPLTSDELAKFFVKFVCTCPRAVSLIWECLRPADFTTPLTRPVEVRILLVFDENLHKAEKQRWFQLLISKSKFLTRLQTEIGHAQCSSVKFLIVHETDTRTVIEILPHSN